MSELNEQTKELFNLAEEIAIAKHDGHITIMRFTTGWKVMFYTPEMTQHGRQEVFEMAGATDLGTAIRNAIVFGK